MGLHNLWNSRVPLVDIKTGTASQEFLRWLQQNTGQISGVDDGVASLESAITSKVPSSRQIITPAAGGLTGGGSLSGDLTLSADVQKILDELTTTRGSVLYRGAAGWQALAPDTAGKVLQTNGAGADPSWASAGGAAWDFNPPSAASMTLISGDATQLALTDDANVGLIASYNSAGLGGQVQRCALRTLTNKTLDWTLTVKMKSLIPGINYRGTGLLLYDSLSANNIGFQITTDSGFRIAKWTNLLGAGGVNLVTININGGVYIEWLRVVHTGGNYIFYMSENGKLWVEHSRVVDTAQMANRADKVGFSTYNWNGGAVTQMTVPYFTLTGPGV